MNLPVRKLQAGLMAILLAASLLPALSIAPGPALAQTAVPTRDSAPSPLPTPNVTPTVAPGAPVDGATEQDADQIEALLAGMSVADRVGQLFLITFRGDEVGLASDITTLINEYRVGGVVLSARNGNFSNEAGVDTPVQVATLVNQLQAAAYGFLLPEAAALPNPSIHWPPADIISLSQRTGEPPVNLPLLIAVEQAGDHLPATALRRGFTPLPSAMALGATWNPELANQVGQIAGRELAAVGVNLLLGPILDVVEQPRPDEVGALGIHSFGGDPEWVSRMGRAYITGVHTGGGGQVATVARHFPGAGDADRLPDQEVATVQRSASELRQIALPPFLAVTHGQSSIHSPAGDPATTDAIMSSHIRYSGFQGASRGRNIPLSLAPELKMVLDQEGLADWRKQGGLVVSNQLGAPAIRRHYNPDLSEFNSRQVASDAFAAGHDLLYLGRFSLDDQWESELRNIQETILFFQESYQRDPDFAAQVDAAVRRILQLKLRLYGAGESTTDLDDSDGTAQTLPVPLDQVLVQSDDLAVLEETHASSLATVGQVARDSFTLLYPDPASATDIVSVSPQSSDQILVITDSRLLQECAECTVEVAVGPDEVADIIMQLYGPTGTGQITPTQVSSMAFADLDQVLAAEQAAETSPPESAEATPTPAPTGAPPATPLVASPDEPEGARPLLANLDKNAKINQQIEEADWVIFAMLDVDAERFPHSTVVKRFLRQRGNQLANKHIAVLALHAPFFLDATEISKLNGYYGVYSKTQPFLESAVRGIFRAFSPAGAPPVSVAGTRFDRLAERLLPDPMRPIPVQVLSQGGEVLAGANVTASTPLTMPGTMVRIQAGPIQDHNGKPVRNGTPVELVLAYADNPAADDLLAVSTQNGVAVQDVVLDGSGVMRVAARSGDAASIAEVALSVPAALPPGTDATVTPAITGAAVAAGSPLTSDLAVDAAVQPGIARRPLSLISLAVALLTMLATLSLLLIVLVRVLPRATLVHSMLWAINFGLAGYILYGLGWVPGGAWLQGSLQTWGVGLVVFISMLLPMVWLQLRIDEG
jgi:beta-N-acetylhexosaminidase